MSYYLKIYELQVQTNRLYWYFTLLTNTRTLKILLEYLIFTHSFVSTKNILNFKANWIEKVSNAKQSSDSVQVLFKNFIDKNRAMEEPRKCCQPANDILEKLHWPWYRKKLFTKIYIRIFPFQKCYVNIFE
jgi:hypothetical protein